MIIQIKARNLFEDLNGNYPEGVQAFTANSGVLQYSIVLLVYLLLMCL
jgi:hypothetical protein